MNRIRVFCVRVISNGSHLYLKLELLAAKMSHLLLAFCQDARQTDSSACSMRVLKRSYKLPRCIKVLAVLFGVLGGYVGMCVACVFMCAYAHHVCIRT